MSAADGEDVEHPPYIDVHVVINRSVEDVFAFTDNITSEAIWRRGLVESEQLTDGPVGVGTQGRTVWKFMGRAVESIWEIVEYEPNRIVKWRSLKAPVPHWGAWTYEPADDGTTFRFMAQPDEAGTGWLSGLRPAATRQILERAVQADLDNLKRLIEA